MTDQRICPLPPVADPLIVDLFAGPGGLDVAAHWLDIPAIGIELDESAIETRQAARLTSIVADVTKWGPSDFTSAANVLTGGPPCQTFTVAGNGHGRKALDQVVDLVELIGDGRIDGALKVASQYEDPRTGLVLQPLIWALRAMDAGRPFEAILLEQVPSVRPVWEAMALVLEASGYGVDVGVLHTEEYGVPQTRRRALLAARLGVDSADVEFPGGTHQKYIGTPLEAEPVLDLFDDKPRWVSMADVLGWPESFTVISNYGSGGDPKNRSKRRHDRPAFTVTGKVSRNRIELDGDGGERRFSWADAGRLQTFPWKYPWSGTDVSQQIGNAIPPRLGAHVLGWLLGRDAELNQEFFAAREGAWTGPTDETAERAMSAIARRSVVGEPLRTVIGAPIRVESADGQQLELVPLTA